MPMLFTTLHDKPDFVQKTVKLIETSFGYTNKHSFLIDFYPLLAKSNHKNCHIIIHENEVIAHIGVLRRVIENSNLQHSITMYGGIAVSPDYRGMGLFKKLNSSISSLYNETALHMLWSDKLDLYKKINFSPAIDLFEYKQEKSPHPYVALQKKICDLNSEETSQLKMLYRSSSEIRIHRTDKDWEDLKEITSADLYLIYLDEELINYFIMNKGADLESIIHEYGFINKEQLDVMKNFGKVWSSVQLTKDSSLLYSALIKPGDLKSFSSFIFDLYNFKVTNTQKDFVEFEYKNESFKQTQTHFLQGIFGPGQFEELCDTRKVYICGLDSI